MTSLLPSTIVRTVLLMLNLIFGTAAIAEAGELNQGPSIVVVAPAANAVLETPCNIKIRFEQTGPASVDLATLKVTLMTLWGIDLTERVRPYASREGIHMANADIPKGQHTLKIAISDADGRESYRILTVMIK